MGIMARWVLFGMVLTAGSLGFLHLDTATAAEWVHEGMAEEGKISRRTKFCDPGFRSVHGWAPDKLSGHVRSQ
jgi:hypothetical protein